MLATAAHLTDHVVPPLLARPRVLAVSKHLRYVLFCTATPVSWVLLRACSCGWWSDTCVRKVQVQALWRATAP